MADWKSKITLFDQTLEEWSEGNKGIVLNLFWQDQHQLPKVEAGDVVIASLVTRQHRNGEPSLITNKGKTDVHVYDGQRIANCKGSRSARDAFKPPSKKVHRELDQKQHEYVLWLYGKINDLGHVPDKEVVAAMAERTVDINKKFSLLQDVKIKKFADLIVQVVEAPYDLGDRMTIWVSDYTKNEGFFDKISNDSDWIDGKPIRDGDPYGYTSKWSNHTNPMQADEKWLGPYGKRSMQVTCWEPHSDFVRNNVQAGDWIHLRNVQIDYGKNGSNIEGKLRTDRQYPSRLYVNVLDNRKDRETLDPRLLDAIRRKRDYGKDHKQTLKGGTKRKSEGSAQSSNAKIRRKILREQKAKMLQEQEAKQKSKQDSKQDSKQQSKQKSKQEAALGLNDLIKCENADKEIVPFPSILEPVRYDTTFELPFTCAKYRTLARVVDFHPANLEDFAASRKISEFHVLSDNSDGDSDSDSSSASENDGRRIWEWRFALKLEEASSTSGKGRKPASAWVLVDNAEAQLLTDLDANDLRSEDNAGLLERLRQQMFILWGDLEERKAAIEARKGKNGWTKAPPLSDEEDNVADTGHGPGLLQASNKAFACCIRQYGVKVVEEDGEGNAGERTKWQRIFGLFGTKICSD
ncbi:hypothetical protein SLS53_000298 [Cytospora paraplurivora]|uniref:Protection of telomeres protein 1 ssDNA-binding domain-containing protein n=1 Tax=Cytospora paraplurivora TaxID=2898453 RepID=A0AAN9YPQ8_9PEZI